MNHENYNSTGNKWVLYGVNAQGCRTELFYGKTKKECKSKFCSVWQSNGFKFVFERLIAN